MQDRDFFSLGLVAFVALALAPGRPPVEVTSSSPDSVIQRLYTTYRPNNQIPSADAIVDRPELSLYFTPELWNLLRKDRLCASEPADVCQLAQNPVMETPAASAEGFGKVAIERQGSGMVAAPRYRVTMQHGGTLVYEMHNTHSGWKIADIYYPKQKQSLRRRLSMRVS